MCLGEIMRVRSVASSGSLMVDRADLEVTASSILLDTPPEVGDWVLMHSGFVLEVLTEQEALDALSLRSGKHPE
jgi:hydrogenase expression/formation protein HypC